jgi:hypothetical protein
MEKVAVDLSVVVSDAVTSNASSSVALAVAPQPYITQATRFKANADFDVYTKPIPDQQLQHLLRQRHPYLEHVLEHIKAASAGKMSIIGLGDKLTLANLVDRINQQHSLQINQAKMHLWMRLYDKYRVGRGYYGSSCADVKRFLAKGNYDFAVKPTHLSSGDGLLLMDRHKWNNEGWTETKLFSYMLGLLHKPPPRGESAALQAIIPGVVVQDRYPFPKEKFHAGRPIEVRVQTVWGKAYMGVFWQGYEYARTYGNNIWVVPDGKDGWEAKTPSNDGIISSMAGDGSIRVMLKKLIAQHMEAMVQQAEHLAAVTGASWLRVDFFLPPPGVDKPVTMNEVAYGSGILYHDPEQPAMPFFQDAKDKSDERNLANAVIGGYNARAQAGVTSQPPIEFFERFGLSRGMFAPTYGSFSTSMLGSVGPLRSMISRGNLKQLEEVCSDDQVTHVCKLGIFGC